MSLAIRQSFGFLGQPVQPLVAVDRLLGQLLDQALGAGEPVIHQHLGCQQMPLTIAQLVEDGLDIAEALVGISWAAHRYLHIRRKPTDPLSLEGASA